MEDEKRVSSESAEELAKKNAEADRAAAAGGATAGAREFDALIAENQALRAQSEELNDRNLRLVAEMENLRRRTERDKSEFAKYAISEFARDILSVGDNLRRAIEALPKEVVGSHPGVTALVEGVEVTERELLKVLERFQVKRFDPLGEPFNPHLHEAMTKVDVPNVPADTVIQTIHAGYMIGDRVLRPAAVIVAKGGAVAEQPRASEPEETIPPGAMRVPDDAVSSSPPPRGPEGDPYRNRQGGPGPQEPRRGPGERNDPGPDERMATFKRARQAGVGGGAGAPPLDNQRQQQPGTGRSSTLHKPVIDTKREW